VTTGITLKTALDAAPLLEKHGLRPTILHCHTIKPLDVEALRRHAAQVPVVVTVEEHTVVGGLGSAVAEVLAETSFDAPKRFRRIGIPDAFADKYGSQASLMARYGITGEGVAQAVTELSARAVVGR